MALLDFFKKRKEIDRFLNKRKMKTRNVHAKQKRAPVFSEKEEEKSKSPTGNKAAARMENYGILKSPHITEKSSIAITKGAYVFKVRPDANKIMVKNAIKDLYGAKTRKINIINIHSRKRFIKGKRGSSPGFKKAIVYLEKGEKIEV